jgi:outer membrane protein OmpA-like peptidoglycan-associated protein
MKKSLLVLSLLLLVVPGCGSWKKSKNKIEDKSLATKNGKEFVAVDIPLAQEINVAGELDSIDSFFDESSDVTANTSNVTSSNEYAWNEEQSAELNKVYFGFDEYIIDNLQQSNIEKNAQQLKATIENEANKVIVVEGHACSSAGSATYNLALSEKRAKITADRLVNAGIPQEKIKIVGRGKEVPALINDKPVTGSREEQWPNRRVETHVIEA